MLLERLDCYIEAEGISGLCAFWRGYVPVPARTLVVGVGLGGWCQSVEACGRGGRGVVGAWGCGA